MRRAVRIGVHPVRRATGVTASAASRLRSDHSPSTRVVSATGSAVRAGTSVPLNSRTQEMASTVMGARSTTNSSGFSQTGFFISEEPFQVHAGIKRSEEHTSELPSLMRISYAVFCLKKKIKHHSNH